MRLEYLPHRQYQLYEHLYKAFDESGHAIRLTELQKKMDHLDRRSTFEMLKQLIAKGFVKKVDRGLYAPLKKTEPSDNFDYYIEPFLHDVLERLEEIKAELKELNSKIE